MMKLLETVAEHNSAFWPVIGDYKHLDRLSNIKFDELFKVTFLSLENDSKQALIEAVSKAGELKSFIDIMY